ncbi:MAG: hypothetical protein CVT82_02615 [Alphaproteobacteria bacterium HGW-Alphaproteobacteria-4]|jgi:uncharacterized membrane protein YgcG|nr:MAG: hypothetical protein CVT82_02615 [Alphaproteobacteria bacterium HGW-Alphaproteobacteria-4]
MKRMKALSLIAALVLTASAAHAESFAERVGRQLRAEGYANITISRTLLGRARIVAVKEDGTREIVIDPRTGHVLRDIWIGNDRVATLGHFALQDERETRGSDSSGSGQSGGGSGSSGNGGGNDGGGDDDNHDDDDDEHDDDEHDDD